jgi:hypothetical protein
MATVSEALSRTHVQYAVKLYIKNNSDTWVDFTDRFGEDRLRGLRAIHHLAEGPHGHPTTKSFTLTADNSDRYWDSDPASAYDPWEGRDVQVRLDVADASETTLATMRIAPDGIQTDLGADATIKLEPLTETLARVDADSIKHGEGWHQFRPWTFLVQEPIRSEFGESDGTMPVGYSFPDDPRFTFPDGAKHSSVWGKPPQWDGTDWNSDNTGIPYCVVYDQDNSVLYYGIGDNVWKFNPATDTWTDIGTGGGSAYTVRGLFVADDVLVACKWDESTSSITTTLEVRVYDLGLESWDATASTTVSNFFSGRFWYYDGADIGGTDRARGRYNGGPGGSPEDYGTNIPVPFQQYVRDVGAGTVEMTSSASQTTDQGWGATHNTLPNNAPEQYKLFKDDASNNALGVRIAYGNRPNLDWDRQDSGEDGWLYVVTESSGTYYVKVVYLTAGSSATTFTVTTSGESSPIHSIRLQDDKSNLYYIIFTEDTTASGYDATSVKYVSTVLPAGAPSTAFTAGTNTANNDDLITDLLGTDGTNIFYIKMLQARGNKWPRFQVCKYASSTESILASSSQLFRPAISRPSTIGFPYLYQDAATGALSSIASAGATPALLDSGIPPVYDAPTCMDFAYSTGADPDIFGLSAPAHDPEYHKAAPDGKYFAWQYAATHTGRVDLADFTGLTKLEAVGLLCQAFAQSVFPERDGDWVVQARDPGGASGGTIGPGRFDKGWVILRRVKSADIVNYVELTPYDSVLGAMDTKLYQKPDSQWDGSISAAQLDTKEKRLRLRCIHGGYISGAVPGSSSPATRWDILVYRSTIETRLGAAYTSGTSVTLESVWDIEVGDYIQTSDSETREITATTVATKIVTIDSGFSSGFPILSPAVITKANQEKWSSQGVTTLDGAINSSVTSIDVDNAGAIGVGNFILMGEEEAEVTAIDDETLTVTRGDNATSHGDGDTVGLIVKPSDLSAWTLVGGYGIKVVFEHDGAETPFLAGDYLEFICPGLSLEKRKGSKVIAADQDSIDKPHGKRKPRGRIDNRFMTFRLGEFYANTLVARYPSRKRRFRVGMRMDVDYFIGDVVTVESADLLPDESSNQLDCIVKEVVYTPFHGTTQTEYIVEEQ